MLRITRTETPTTQQKNVFKYRRSTIKLYKYKSLTKIVWIKYFIFTQILHNLRYFEEIYMQRPKLCYRTCKMIRGCTSIKFYGRNVYCVCIHIYICNMHASYILCMYIYIYIMYNSSFMTSYFSACVDVLFLQLFPTDFLK